MRLLSAPNIQADCVSATGNRPQALDGAQFVALYSGVLNLLTC